AAPGPTGAGGGDAGTVAGSGGGGGGGGAPERPLRRQRPSHQPANESARGTLVRRPVVSCTPPANAMRERASVPTAKRPDRRRNGPSAVRDDELSDGRRELRVHLALDVSRAASGTGRALPVDRAPAWDNCRCLAGVVVLGADGAARSARSVDGGARRARGEDRHSGDDQSCDEDADQSHEPPARER